MTTLSGILADSASQPFDGILRIQLVQPLVTGAPNAKQTELPIPHDTTITNGTFSVNLPESETAQQSYLFTIFQSSIQNGYYLDDGTFWCFDDEGSHHVWSVDGETYTGYVHTTLSQHLNIIPNTILTQIGDPFYAVIPDTQTVDFADLEATGFFTDRTPQTGQQVANILKNDLTFLQKILNITVPTNVYSPTVLYHIGDGILYNGVRYVCADIVVFNISPDQDPTKWLRLGTSIDSIVGKDGNTIQSGAGAPSSATGAIGDFYIDTTGSNIYGPKTSNGWGNATSLIGAAGATGAAGTPGANGNTIYSGGGAPSAGLGNNGDFYIDTTAWNIYAKVSGIWGSATSLIGPQGATGAAGRAGIDGSAIRSGSGAPLVNFGNNNDFYIDTTAWNLYGPKTSGVWGNPIALQGAQGIQGVAGANGTNGNLIYSGSGAPSSSLGSDGDIYIDTTASYFYGPKASGVWGNATSLIGAAGAPGANGNTILSGTAVPDNSLGNNGDFYFNITNTTLYGPKVGGAWGNAIALKGINGTNGVDGRTIYSGTGAPDAGLGNIGDFYVDTAATYLYGAKTSSGWGTAINLIGAANSIRSGSGVPDASLGNLSDFYIDYTAWNIYGPKTSSGWGSATSLIGAQGIQGVAGAVGATGATGVQGIQGVAGANGNTILSGSGVPASGLGNIGDFYIDKTGINIYGSKTSNGWGSATSLIGPQGAQGIQGIIGAQGATGASGRSVLSGNGAPVTQIGNVGDFYIDISTWNIYGPRTSSSWGGATSLVGLQGTSIRSGSGAPSSSLGNNGDFYIDTTASNLYGPKSAGAWGSGTSLIGATGAQGIQGVAGNTILSGNGAPASSLGVVGNFYIDITVWNIYGPKNSGGWGNATSLIGQTGAQGIQGIAGNTILSGNGAPSSGLGNNGDFYIDNTASELYGPKTSGAWGSGISLIGASGAQGIQGVAGSNGNTVLSGSGAPSSGLGVNSNFYIDTTAWNIYGPKTSSGWGSSTSLIGPQGATGATGAQGIQGVAGSNGNTILSGSGAPSSGIGNIGDFYINISNWSIYGAKTSGGWGVPTSLIGATGATGAAGNTILSGSGAPSSGLGVVGNFYIDSTAWNIYGPKSSSGWGSATSLIGSGGSGGSSASIISNGCIADFQFTETSGITVNNSISGSIVGNGTITAIDGSTPADYAWGKLHNFGLDLSVNNATQNYVLIPTFQTTDSNSSFYCEVIFSLRQSPNNQNWQRIFDYPAVDLNREYNILLTSFSANTINNSPVSAPGFGWANDNDHVAELDAYIGSYNNIPLAYNTPSLITFGYDGAANIAHLSVNGVQFTQNSSFAPAVVSRVLWLGRSQFSGDPKCTGTYFRVTCYNRFLSLAERQNNIAAHKEFMVANGVNF